MVSPRKKSMEAIRPLKAGDFDSGLASVVIGLV
jgi:hypothetical protein